MFRHSVRHLSNVAGPAPTSEKDALAKALEALANPLRLSILHRLARPAFMPDLAQELGMTRQAIKKHLDALEEIGLIVASPSRRGALRAMEYAANPAGLFAFKMSVLELAVDTDPAMLPPATTMPATPQSPTGTGHGFGLLLVHGDLPGRWFPLNPRTSSVLGRDPKAEIPLAYDAFASSRHALLRFAPGGWTLTDLQSTNGTRVNFRPVKPGETTALRQGDLITIGKSHLLLRDGL